MKGGKGRASWDERLEGVASWQTPEGRGEVSFYVGYPGRTFQEEETQKQSSGRQLEPP